LLQRLDAFLKVSQIAERVVYGYLSPLSAVVVAGLQKVHKGAGLVRVEVDASVEVYGFLELCHLEGLVFMVSVLSVGVVLIYLV
jgi:hypothetical protein